MAFDTDFSGGNEDAPDRETIANIEKMMARNINVMTNLPFAPLSRVGDLSEHRTIQIAVGKVACPRLSGRVVSGSFRGHFATTRRRFRIRRLLSHVPQTSKCKG